MNILMVSLGCDKNLCDSEAMLGLLAKHNYNITNDEQEADAIIVNTCSFIKDAMEESVNTVLEMAKLKQQNLKYLIVTGCMAQRFKDEIFDEIPEIDACLGTSSFDKILDVIEELKARDGIEDAEEISVYDDIDRLATITESNKVITSGTFMGYLKIAEGCDKFCTYCVIPHIRGHYRSVPMEQLLKEAEYMASQGIEELVLVAQETTCYGKDLYGEKRLHVLVRELAKIDGIKWIRLMYCYPEEIYEELIDSMIKDKKVCHYLDMPVQHCNDTILQRMGRKTNKKELIERIHYLRKRVPDITLRTSLICGFPGETKEQHEELMQFVNDMEFDRLGAFTYSAEEGTPAAEMPDQVPQEQKEEWQADVMELQEEVIFDKNEAMKGTVLYAFIEGQVADENNTYVGRTYRDAPNVDGYIFINTDEELLTGDIVKVEVTGAYEYDLIATIVK